MAMSYERILNNYGTYHIYARGNDRLAIFARPEDKEVLLNQLFRSQSIHHFILYAYSIMNNHIHLLYKDVGLQMPTIVGTLFENYAKYYSAVHNHTGQVFESPFKSKPVYTISYFYTLVCYIENNPVKANKVNCYSDYEWNSSIYIPSRLNLVDTIYLKKNFERYRNYSLDLFIREHESKNKLCSFEVSRVSNYDAKILFSNIIKSICGQPNIEVKSLNDNLLQNIISQAYYRRLTIKQIADISGVSLRYIRKYKGERDYI